MADFKPYGKASIRLGLFKRQDEAKFNKLLTAGGYRGSYAAAFKDYLEASKGHYPVTAEKPKKSKTD